MQNNIDNFSHFGYTFQVKLIYSLLNDSKFLERIIESLNTKYFDNDSFSWIIDIIRKHFVTYKSAPNLEALAVYVKEIPNDALRETVKNSLRETYKDTTGTDFIKDKTIDFCKNQALKHAIYDSVELFKSGDHQAVRKIIDEALKVGLDTDIGHEYTKMFADRISETSRKVVPTGWSVVDNIIDGGFGPGELGVIVAPAGIGKSWALVCMAANAIKKGYTVIYYTMELNQSYVGLRFDSHFTGIPSQNLKYHKEDVEQKISEISGNLIIKYYPTKTATIQTLRGHIEKTKIVKQFTPDIIFVDYADLLIGVGKEKRLILENVYEDLRGLAGEMQVPIWTASQANKSALEHDVIEADKVAEAYAKVMIADFVMSVSRRVADKVSGTARWHIIKNRMGKDGITFPSNFNASNGQIDILEPQSNIGKETTHKMENSNEVVRQLLKRKFDELEDTKSGFE